jgi:potassium efflux system protein
MTKSTQTRSKPAFWANLVLLLVFSLLTIPVFGQDTQTVGESEVDADLLNLKIESVEASTTLDEQVAGTLVDLYRRALTNLERARSEQAYADELATAGSKAPDELTKLRTQIDRLRASRDKDDAKIPSRAKLADLELSLAEEKAKLNENEVSLDDLRNQYTNEVARPGEARSRLSAARTERELALAGTKGPAPIGQSTEVTEARRWHLQTRTTRLTSEMRKLEQELLTHEPRLELIATQQELTELQLETTRTRARLLENTISKRRGAEAEQALKDAVNARQELVSQHPEIARIAAENVALGDRLTQRTLDITSAADERDAAQQQVTRLTDSLSSTGNKLAIAGLNQTLGELLIDQRRALPDLRNLKKQTRLRERQVASIGLEQIGFSEQRRNLRKSDSDISKLTIELSAKELGEIGPELKTLTENQSELLDKSLNAGARYLRVLGELDLAQRQLTDTVTEYKEFLDRTLLWVRTTAPVDIKTVLTLPDHFSRFFALSSWQLLAENLVTALNNSPNLVSLLIGLLLLGL